MLRVRLLTGLFGLLATAGVAAAPAGVAGAVTQAPGCPGPQRIGQGTCELPVAGVIVELRNAAGKVMASAATGADGRFSLDAAPGAYRLHVAIEGVYPRCPDTKVTVRKGKVAAAGVQCDSGMR